MTFDSFAMVDWSSGNDTGPRPKKDAIWAGAVLGGREQAPVYLRNRDVALGWVRQLIDAELAAGRRLLIGFDFPFGYPQGFSRAVTGRDDPLALWEYIGQNLADTPRQNNRFDLAGALNAKFPGAGPFWFNALARDIPHLPRKGTARNGHGMPERRQVETLAKGTFTCWQMGGAGSVGGQAITGIAALQSLRHAYTDKIAVWPFEDLDAPVAFVEIWPSLINSVVRDAKTEIRDSAQVRLMARALARLPSNRLAEMMHCDAPEEGWILGLGYEDQLKEAAMSGLTPPRLKDDCFALPPGVDWTPVDDALARLAKRLTSVVQAEQLALHNAAGRVLAEPAVATRANPPAANSAVDGFGFAHKATGEGDQLLTLVDGRAAAGQPYAQTVPDGQAIRILTGALLPVGVDTVVLEEDTTTDGTQIAFEGPVKKGANTRKAGEDILGGETAVTPGTRLGPAQIAICAATGITEVTVYRPLRVGVLSTGDEIVEPGSATDVARTYDANRPMLLSLIRDWQMEPVDLGHVPDDRAALTQRLNDGAATCDAILTSGGASAGDEDHLSALLGETGTRADWRIALKPGRPLALGVWDGTPIFGLPGNPVAALVCTLIFARPAFATLGGEGWRSPQGFTVPAAFEKNKKPGRREYLRARINAEGAVEVFQSEGSGRISGLAWADGLVEIKDAAQTIKPGDAVRYIPYSSFR